MFGGNELLKKELVFMKVLCFRFILVACLSNLYIFVYIGLLLLALIKGLDLRLLLLSAVNPL